MEYKILESIGVEITHIDGAAFNNFSAGSESGVISGISDECKVSLLSNTTVQVSTGELLIKGFRVKIISPYTIEKEANSTSVNYYLIAKLTLAGNTVMFDLEARTSSSLKKDSLFKTNSGTYEIEIARFTVGSSGITDLSQTVKVISGPIGTSTGGGGLTPEQSDKLDTVYGWYEDIQSDGITGLTPTEKDKLGILIKQYDDANYKYMVASIDPPSKTFLLGSKQKITFTWSFKVNGNTVTPARLWFNSTEIKDATLISKTIENIQSTSSYEIKGKRSDGNQEEAKATSWIYFYNNYYYGYASKPDTIDNTFLKTLKRKSGWATSKPSFTDTPTVPDGQYLWLAYPSHLGPSSFTGNGFPSDFVLSTPKIVNDSKYEETYYVYRSLNPSLGKFTLVVS
jgi:hypothetical protein